MKKVYFSKQWFVGVVAMLICGNTLAQGLPDVPREGRVFYTEDGNGNTIKKTPRKASSNNWDITSTVENCFDEGTIGEYAWLMTADGETKLSVTLTYSGDDSRYTISSQEVKFYFYDGNDLFHDDNKELITETERFVGAYTTDNTDKTATVHITAPSYYEYTTNAYYTYYVVIKVKFKNGGSASVAKNIGISRPGVIILHGLNDSSSTFQPLKNYLVNSGQFISSQILTKDYAATNTSSFYANTHQNQVVRVGLFELSNSLFAVGIASTKYDMVGHSMGGILERLYNQEVDNKHTNKLITLNTPHYGAPLGNVAPAFFTLVNTTSYSSPVMLILKQIADKYFNPNGGRQAVADLAIGSTAINNLNSSSAQNLYGIPVYAVGTYFSDVEENDYAYSDPTMATDEAAYLFAHIFYNDVPRNRYDYLLDKVVGDGIVSLESQRGGLSDFYCSMFSDSWKWGVNSNAFHCNSPKWTAAQNEIRLLLLSEPTEYNFCLTGFPSAATYARAKAPLHITSNYNTDFEEPKPTTFINIEVNATFGQDYTHEIVLKHSDDMLTMIAFSELADEKIVSGYDNDTIRFNLAGYEEDAVIYAIGRTEYNALVMDSIKVNLGQANGIKELRHDTNLKYSVDGNKINIEDLSEPYRLTIYDIAGRVLADMDSNPSHIYTLPANNGLLIVGVRTKEGTQTLKIRTFPN